MDFQLAWRNIWRNPKRTGIILTAITIGVSAMITLASLSRGMAGGMVENAIDNLIGHIKIMNPEYRTDPDISHRMDDYKEIVALAAPLLPEGSKLTRRIRVDAVAANARETVGVELVSIDPAMEAGVSFISHAPVEGARIKKGDLRGVLMGAALAQKLQTGIGKKLVVTTQKADGESGSRAFRIRGLFHAEMEATEKAFLFVTHQAAERLLGQKDIATEVAITLPKGASDKEIAVVSQGIKEALAEAPVSVTTWRDLLPAITAYLAMFDSFLIIWFVVIFIAMGFGIVNTILMAVYERMREFGLLKAIGMKPSRIIAMVLSESIFLLVAGCILGTALGVGFVWYFSQGGINLGSFSQGTQMLGISRIIRPMIFQSDIIVANAVVVILGGLVSIYPALKAARFTPIDTMNQA